MDDKERIQELERRIGALEREAPQRAPIGPAVVPIWPSAPNIGERRCPTCRTSMLAPMGYVCPHPDCPGRVTCGGSSDLAKVFPAGGPLLGEDGPLLAEPAPREGWDI